MYKCSLIILLFLEKKERSNTKFRQQESPGIIKKRYAQYDPKSFPEISGD